MTSLTNHIQAIIFDRDGTLCHPTTARESSFHAWVREKSHYDPVPFSSAQRTVNDEFIASHRVDMVTDLGVEARFWLDFWRRSLTLLGVDESFASEALDKFVYYKWFELYTEVPLVIATLDRRGFALGVISNTFPSLRDSLVYLGVSDYFSVVVDSSNVGAMKPSPLIYQKALSLLNVSPEQTLFVDNEHENVIAAQRLGMEALWLERQLESHQLENSIIADLSGVIAYLPES